MRGVMRLARKSFVLYATKKYLPETVEYIRRVEKDGGEVKNLDLTNDAFVMLKDSKLLPSVRFFYSPNFGVKTVKYGSVEYLIKLYNLVNNGDAEQLILGKQPKIEYDTVIGSYIIKT